MNRRAFIATSGAAIGSTLFSAEPLLPQGVPISQEPLAYSFEALAPYIDAETMKLHYTKHHSTYLTNLKRALDQGHLKAANTISLISTIARPPAAITPDLQRALRENGGGHVNHTLFWRFMAPPGSVPKEPQGKLAEAIQSTFGGFENFKRAFKEEAMKRFGSGWVWLMVTDEGKLAVTSTANQDSPMMGSLVPEEQRGKGILCLDLWEHAYYLTYQNRRQDYIDAWWNVLNWPRVQRAYMIVVA